MTPCTQFAGASRLQGPGQNSGGAVMLLVVIETMTPPNTVRCRRQRASQLPTKQAIATIRVTHWVCWDLRGSSITSVEAVMNLFE
jgi:hypothetical protein